MTSKLKLTPEGYRYLLVAADCFSKWVVLHLLKTKTSEEISGWYYQHFLSQYGKLRWFRVDASIEFARVFTQVCDGTGITVFKALSGYTRIK